MCGDGGGERRCVYARIPARVRIRGNDASAQTARFRRKCEADPEFYLQGSDHPQAKRKSRVFLGIHLEDQEIKQDSQDSGLLFFYLPQAPVKVTADKISPTEAASNTLFCRQILTIY